MFSIGDRIKCINRTQYLITLGFYLAEYVVIEYNKNTIDHGLYVWNVNHSANVKLCDMNNILTEEGKCFELSKPVQEYKTYVFNKDKIIETTTTNKDRIFTKNECIDLHIKYCKGYIETLKLEISSYELYIKTDRARIEKELREIKAVNKQRESV